MNAGNENYSRFAVPDPQGAIKARIKELSKQTGISEGRIVKKCLEQAQELFKVAK